MNPKKLIETIDNDTLMCAAIGVFVMVLAAASAVMEAYLLAFQLVTIASIVFLIAATAEVWRRRQQ